MRRRPPTRRTGPPDPYSGRRYRDLKRRFIAGVAPVCALCGGRVDVSLSGNHRAGPTIDHKVAITAGGSFWDVANWQLCHRVCNLRKGRGDAPVTVKTLTAAGGAGLSRRPWPCGCTTGGSRCWTHAGLGRDGRCVRITVAPASIRARRTASSSRSSAKSRLRAAYSDCSVVGMVAPFRCEGEQSVEPPRNPRNTRSSRSGQMLWASSCGVVVGAEGLEPPTPAL
jgi:hypothetical protein